MHHFTQLKLVLRVFALYALFFIASIAQAQTLSKPANVSALIYSSTASELFWTPQAGSLVEVTRNGELLGRFDSRSLYQSGLQTGKQYQYTLRSIDGNGGRSQAVALSINTADFSSPDKRIYPINTNGGQTQSEPTTNVTPTPTIEVTEQATLSAPIAISAFIYSSSAAELFWTPHAGSLVEVSRNGQVLGRFGSRSLYQPGLQKGKRYQYTLRSVDENNRHSPSISMVINTANFIRPDLQILPTASNSAGNDNVVAQPEQTPEPIDNPVVTVTELTNIPLPGTDSPVLPPEDNTDTKNGGSCIASDVNSLLACVRTGGANGRIDLSQDITCTGNCCPNGSALLKINGLRNLKIAGNGHRLLRTNGHRQCSLLDIDNATNISVNNVFLDDDRRVGGCQVTDRCPRMVHIKSSNNIRFDQVHISHGKGYAFYVQGTDGFGFDNSTLHNSGVLGMYIGHGDNASSNIRINGSVFSDNQTNGLAIRGLRGPSITSNLVSNNVFIRNHRRGQWAVAPKFGTGFTGGGQLYIAQAENITVRNNVVKDGYCANCFVQRKNRSGVSGIEIGLPNTASVRNAQINNNTVTNHDAFGISQNANTVLSNVKISSNQLLNNSSGVQMAGNRVITTQRFDSFEANNDVGSVFKGSVSCSANGSVSRRCDSQARFGQCAVQLKLGSADCDNVQAELLGPRITVREGQSVVANGWVQNPTGQWCVLFRDGSGNKLKERCKNLGDTQRSDIQSFVGLPGIDERSPAGSRTVQLRVTHSQAGKSMVLDDLKLSVGN